MIAVIQKQMKRLPVAMLPGLLFIIGIGAVMLYHGLFVESSPAVSLIGLGFVGFAAYYFLSY